MKIPQNNKLVVVVLCANEKQLQALEFNDGTRTNTHPPAEEREEECDEERITLSQMKCKKEKKQ